MKGAIIQQKEEKTLIWNKRLIGFTWLTFQGMMCRWSRRRRCERVPWIVMQPPRRGSLSAWVCKTPSAGVRASPASETRHLTSGTPQVRGSVTISYLTYFIHFHHEDCFISFKSIFFNQVFCFLLLLFFFVKVMFLIQSIDRAIDQLFNWVPVDTFFPILLTSQFIFALPQLSGWLNWLVL